MKKLIALLLCLLLLCGAASAEQLTFGSLSFDSGAEEIDLGEQAVTSGGKTGWSSFIRFLSGFPNLKKVDMFATPVTESQVNRLREAFPDVSFGWTLKMMRYHLIRTDATAYSTLHGKHPNHSSKEFALLKYCPNLLALDLGHNNLTDISFLDSMPHLRVLIFGENARLRNIEKIASLKELEYLELFTCGITDISPLAGLTKLTDLNLCNNRVEDWRPLKQMKQLKRLWISGMMRGKMKTAELTEAELKELREALPDTEIVCTGEPTDNGWREDPVTGEKHPHYAVIYEMFQTGTYIPFEESGEPAPEEPSDSFLVEEIPLD